MIIREQERHFVMIEQHRHALLSGDIYRQWKTGNLANDSLQLAISLHDCGWKSADKEPLWNEYTHAPYTFTDFPVPLKALLYTNGIHSVARKNEYAALLCSGHYMKFMSRDDSPEAKSFMAAEQARKELLVPVLPDFEETLFDVHLALLELCDNLSLFICLNDPGLNEHPFFKKGIPLAPALSNILGDHMHVEWNDSDTLRLQPFPLNKETTLTVEEKRVSKKRIEEKGLREAYAAAPYEKRTIKLFS